ncbi:MAG TPA: protein kinase [Ideonella sp.]|uniref:serine/threonine-protein kinase n=1 Tax=Ideonella sp. TaxID=1929293 RepID=UPI002CA1EDB3|nr:protein kinase [Ideonella sp.]
MIEAIGQGGMGLVWLAERADGLMQRQVALKLPRVAWGDAFAERLAREREILASLAHPHIARLYDAGVDAHGRPFLAMEYVQGEAIDAYCCHHALPLRERVALLLQVMAAVAHAHARLVVHRDLKPNNILVTPEGQASLLDFGIAKLLDGELTQATALTEQSGRALTLDYASPEQIRGEPLGTASDIYSMAVVAYEVLADVRPYRLKRGSAAELEEVIAGAEVPLASSASTDPALRKQLRGDLDAILNHALKKSAAERYPTMEAFAQDLRRWLDGEPVLARPDRFAYRAAKFIGRHRLPVAAGAAVAVALVAGASVALWQAHEARLQAQRAQAEAATAQAVQGFLEGVFLASSADQTDPKKARDMTARELLDRGVDRIDVELTHAPLARERLLDVLASIYGNMVLTDKEIELRRKVLAQSRSLHGATSGEAVIAMAKLSHALTLNDKRPEALSLLKEAATVLDGRQEQGTRARFEVDVMQAAFERRSNPRQGLVYADRAIDYARSFGTNDDLANALQMKADSAHSLHDYALASEVYAELIRLCEAHPPLGAGGLAVMYESLGDAQTELGHYAEAERNIRKGIERDEKRGASEVTVHMGHAFLSIFLRRTGRPHESIDVITGALRWARSPAGESQQSLAHAIRVHHAMALLAFGRAKDALQESDDDVALKVDAKSVTALDFGLLAMRARALIQLGHLAEAHELLDHARSLRNDMVGKVPTASIDQAERAWLVANGQGAEALADAKAKRVAEKLAPEPGPDAPVSELVEWAGYELAAGHFERARSQADRALESIARGGQVNYQRDKEARATLIVGRALLGNGQVKDAVPVLERAVAMYSALFDPASPELAEAARILAQSRR